MPASSAISAAAALLTVLGAGAADAASLHALTSDGKLVTFDSETRKARPGVMLRSTSGRVVAIALRPADGKLYGLTSTQQLVMIDPRTGSVTSGAKLDKPVETGGRAAINFNPVVDRLRVVGLSGANYRIHVDTGAVTSDGALKYADASPYSGTAPRVTAAAYTNHVAGTKETALYTVDTILGQINLQAPPNDGIQQPRKALGFDVPNGVGFDIVADGPGGNTGYLLAGGQLYSVTLADMGVRPMGPVAGLGTAEVVSLAAGK